jgi:hypothetical protein
LVFVFIPLAMASFGFFIFRMLIWDLADEVLLLDDVLLIRKGRIEERVHLSEVVNVSVTQMTNPVRVSLRMRTRTQFGDEIVFTPKSQFRLNPFARNEVAEKLISLVERARQIKASAAASSSSSV